jgi:hypothetical protein
MNPAQHYQRTHGGSPVNPYDLAFAPVNAMQDQQERQMKAISNMMQLQQQASAPDLAAQEVARQAEQQRFANQMAQNQFGLSQADNARADQSQQIQQEQFGLTRGDHAAQVAEANRQWMEGQRASQEANQATQAHRSWEQQRADRLDENAMAQDVLQGQTGQHRDAASLMNTVAGMVSAGLPQEHINWLLQNWNGGQAAPVPPWVGQPLYGAPQEAPPDPALLERFKNINLTPQQ